MDLAEPFVAQESDHSTDSIGISLNEFVLFHIYFCAWQLLPWVVFHVGVLDFVPIAPSLSLSFFSQCISYKLLVRRVRSALAASLPICPVLPLTSRLSFL